MSQAYDTNGAIKITGAGGGGGADGINRISAGTQIAGTSTTVVFSNSNNVSFGMSNSSIVTASASFAQSTQPVAASAANGSFAFSTLSFSNLNGISFGTSAGSAITASHNALTSQSNQAWSGSNASSTFQTLSFNNANGVSWSNNAGAVEASYTSPVVSNALQSVGSATGSGTNTSRFAADDHVHAGVFSVGVSNAGNTAGDTRVDVGRFVLAGGANITLSQATAAGALNTISIVGGAGGGGDTRMTAFATGNTTQSSTGTIPFSSYIFRGSNQVSVGVSNGSIIVDATTAAQTNQTGGIYVTAQSTGQSSSSTYDLRTLSMVGDGIVSLGWSNGTFRVSATQSNQAFSAAGGSSAFQTLGFSDGNGVSFTNTNGSVGATVRTNYASSVHGHTMTASAVSNTTQSSSGTLDMGGFNIAGAGIASVGISNNSIIVSVPSGGGAGDGGVFAGVSNLGNTAGSTGTVSTGNFVLVGSNGISLSQSTDAAGSAATVTIYGNPPVRSYQFPEPGAPATAAGAILQATSYCQPFAVREYVSGSFFRLFLTMATNSTSFATTANTTFSCSLFTTFNVVLYTRTSQTLSSVSSGSAGMTQQWSLGANANGSQYTITYALSYPITGGTSSYSTSVAVSNASFQLSTNSLTLFTGGRHFDIPMNINMSPGHYWVMLGASSNSSTQGTAAMTGLRISHSIVGHTQFSYVQNRMGQATASSMGYLPALGSFSTAGGGTLASVNMSAITTSASNLVFDFQIKLDSY